MQLRETGWAGAVLMTAIVSMGPSCWPTADDVGGGQSQLEIPRVEVVTRVSTTSGGVEGNDGSWEGSISLDGRFIAFISSATNLDPRDTDICSDVYVRNMVDGTTSLASVGTDGAKPDSGYCDYIVPRPYKSASRVKIRGSDAQHIFFESNAKNLDPAKTSGDYAIFVSDRSTGRTELVEILGNAIDLYDYTTSLDGRFVAYATDIGAVSPRVTSVFLRDRLQPTARQVSVSSVGVPVSGANAHVSSNGQYVIFASNANDVILNDTNRVGDVFLRDVEAATTIRVSVNEDGNQLPNATVPVAISADDRFVFFAENTFGIGGNGRIWMFDRASARSRPIVTAKFNPPVGSLTKIWWGSGQLSTDGKRFAFAGQLVGGIDSAFVVELESGLITPVTVTTPTGAAYLGGSFTVSADLSRFGYENAGDWFVKDDTNNSSDVFVFDRGQW